MKGETSLEEIAAAVGVRIVRPLVGGEFGATLVTDADSRDLVLKVIRSETAARRVALGVRMAGRLRASGYPAPEYCTTGTSPGVTWSLQTVMPGHIPDVLERGFAEQLLTLAERHIDAAGETGDWLAGAMKFGRRAGRAAQEHPAVAPLAGEALAVLDRCGGVALRTGDVVHGDFHHRNFLAEGDVISGVFDWEMSAPGDWRFDVATLAFWSNIVTAQIPVAVAEMVETRLRQVAQPEVIALFGALLSLNLLDFDSRVHPERLAGLIELLEERIAPWWRTVL